MWIEVILATIFVALSLVSPTMLFLMLLKFPVIIIARNDKTVHGTILTQIILQTKYSIGAIFVTAKRDYFPHIISPLGEVES